MIFHNFTAENLGGFVFEAPPMHMSGWVVVIKTAELQSRPRLDTNEDLVRSWTSSGPGSDSSTVVSKVKEPEQEEDESSAATRTETTEPLHVRREHFP